MRTTCTKVLFKSIKNHSHYHRWSKGGMHNHIVSIELLLLTFMDLHCVSSILARLIFDINIGSY